MTLSAEQETIVQQIAWEVHDDRNAEILGWIEVGRPSAPPVAIVPDECPF
jgi:hypothetical protein